MVCFADTDLQNGALIADVLGVLMCDSDGSGRWLMKVHTAITMMMNDVVVVGVVGVDDADDDGAVWSRRSECLLPVLLSRLVLLTSR